MEYQLPSTDPLGTDIMLNDNGDIVIDPAGSLMVTTGIDNVLQSIKVNLVTQPELYLWDGDVGTNLGEYVDDSITERKKTEMTEIIKQRLLQDERIIDVSDVSFDESKPDTLGILITAIIDGYGETQIPVSIGGGA